jgi:hypothetical protein
MAGVDLRTIQALMGHKAINMTLRYAHLAPDHLKKAIEALDTEKSHNNFHNTPRLLKTAQGFKLLNHKPGEGKCPVALLVFKTSLGIVRFPEGSTPSLLRQFQ